MDTTISVVDGKPKLLDRVRNAVRLRHMARSTEKTYVYWCRRYILYHNKRHPLDMGKEEVGAFLTHLAVDQHVSAMLWPASIPTQPMNWAGSTYFLRSIRPSTLVAVFGDATIWIGERSSVPFARQCAKQVSTSMRDCTPFGIRSPRVSWNKERTSAPCRSCWGTTISGRHRFTPMC